LLEIKPDYANLKVDSEILKVAPENVKIGDIIIIKVGEKVPLDGKVIQGKSYLDTSALTGESVPRHIQEGDEILAGMINQTGLLTVEVNKTFGESSISRILELVENASEKKAETEKFITTFAKYYTPVVVFGALLLAVIPPLILPGATFSEWIYRALVVLVISCPCALVISIPLGYFGGIGAAARKGILVKGSNFLDALTQVRTIVFDKTGTLTKGEFIVTDIVSSNGYTVQDILKYAAYAESNSNHPIAKSIAEAFYGKIDGKIVGQIEEVPGHGIKAVIDGKFIITGNDKLLHQENIEHPLCDVKGTVVHVAIDSIYAGYIVISDNLKEDALDTINKLKTKKFETVMLTGDNEFAAGFIAKKLKIDRYFSELLPEDKVNHIEKLINENRGGKVAFVGDGINDAPVLARADVGIAMGALGSDAAIETADIVLMTDSPSKVLDAITIARRTRNIVWQNIIFALSVKLIFIVLGVFGIATMWEAVFGDMGVALIAVFNAIRILNQ
jgi:Cd2+/Zn2+-exporting ATPase